VSDRDVSGRVRARLEQHGLNLERVQLIAAVGYIGLLTKWNSTVNLTSLTLDPIADEAIDRLLVEPFLAAESIELGFGDEGRKLLLDIGSGSGSPAIPLKVARPSLQLAMVESRSRKSAFLREAIRDLSLDGATVITARFEDLHLDSKLRQKADWASVRAVRTDQGLWQAVSAVLSSNGRVLWFRSASEPAEADSEAYAQFFELESVRPLIADRRSELATLRRTVR